MTLTISFGFHGSGAIFSHPLVSHIKLFPVNIFQQFGIISLCVLLQQGLNQST
jgi:hypothetical protein